MSKTARWNDMRAKRPVDDAVVAAHVARMEAEEHAYRLSEIREEYRARPAQQRDRERVHQGSSL